VSGGIGRVTADTLDRTWLAIQADLYASWRTQLLPP